MSLDEQKPTADDAKKAVRPKIPDVVERPISGGAMPAEASYVTQPQVAPDVRDAILRSLYDERAPLLRKRRLDALTEEDAARLAELDAYIGSFALQEEKERGEEVWKKVEALAARVLAVSAER